METAAGKTEEDKLETVPVDKEPEAKTETVEVPIEPHVDDKIEPPPANISESESERLRKAAEQLEELEKVERDYSYQMDKVSGVGKPEQYEEGEIEEPKPEEITETPVAVNEPPASPLKEPEDVDIPKNTAQESISVEQEPSKVILEPAQEADKLEEHPTESQVNSTIEEDTLLDGDKPADEKPKTSKDEVTPAKKKEEDPASIDTPSLMDIINTLSPEKLEEIKAQVMALSMTPEKKATVTAVTESKTPEKKLAEAEPSKEVADETPADDALSVEVGDLTKKSEAPLEEPVLLTSLKPDDCIILLDSDEDDAPKTSGSNVAKKNIEPEAVESQTEEFGNSTEVNEEPLPVPISKRRLDEDKENKPRKFLKQSKECVNPECSRKCDGFQEAPRFVLAFFYVQPKNNKTQFACDDCFEEAVATFEKMGEAMANSLSIADVKIPKKQEMVEIIDSDDEEEKQAVTVPDSEKILFDQELEDEVESILEGFCSKIDFRKQVQSIDNNFTKRINQIENDNLQMEEELKQLERSSLKMYNELYSINKPKVQRRQSIDADAEHSSGKSQALKSLLLSSTQQRVQKIQPKPTFIAIAVPGSTSASTQFDPTEKFYYAIRTRGEVKMHWAACRLLETKTGADNKKTFKIEFIDGAQEKFAEVPGKDLALSIVNEHLKVGARVVARFFTKAKNGRVQRGRFLPGVIGEKLCAYNGQRYLIFCDYGQVQYVSAVDVREIAEASKNVWEDVHPNLRQFIQDYLQSKTSRQRPLLNVRVNQRVPTERNGKWHSNAMVQAVDASLVKMHFPQENVYEWLYRGSKRLGPLYSQGQRENLNARRNDPSISYITIDDDDESGKVEGEEEVKRNTAKKSTAPNVALANTNSAMPAPASSTAAAQAPVKSTVVLNDSFYYLDEPKDIMKKRNFTPRKDIFAKKYVKHTCGPKCLDRNVALLSHTPLSKPLLTCWERQIIRQKTNRWVVYKAPCGRVLRNMNEIHRFLKLSNSVLNVDNFDFDVNIQVLSTFDVTDPKECPLYIADMSEGKEGMKIPIVNAYDDTSPPKLEYSEKRIPQPGVNINTDPAFMACCDCTDDCADKSKCACFQLTIRGFQFANRSEGYDDVNVSYMWKRLYHQVTTGIYECHSGCHCSKRCLNRVVQHPISVKMLLFRTPRKGWGLQSCHDIPKGTFICIYAGFLYREDDANALCKNQDHGDEYFAELDLIETAAPLKEGYEAGVRMDSESEDEEKDSDSDYNDNDDGDEEFKSTARSGSRDIVTRSGHTKRSTSKKQSSDPDDVNSDSDSDEMVHMEPTTGKNMEEVQFKGARGLRKLYGKNEKVFVMDAKTCGNVGRYFNHSCDPNMIVQSVFVDTHDMRFPWIAFFSCRIIKAGEELTWNYNYLVGSVPSKVLFCHCGAKKCTGRIL